MMPTYTGAVEAVLQRFESSFADFFQSFTEREYVLWLGSGISRDRVPNVAALVAQILEQLRQSIDPANPACDYRTALESALQLAGLRAGEQAQVDFAIPVDRWTFKDRIVDSLVGKYSTLLDIRVGSSTPDDYLLWDVVRVAETYGSSTIEPDVEHYCIAILLREGLVESAVTTNWDGLLEKALESITDGFDQRVRVIVEKSDFRQSARRMEIVKVHGCAVRALHNEARFRKLLVGRGAQIARWTHQPQNDLMRDHLKSLYTNRSTLVIGLSAQDANLQSIFAEAIQMLARSWPCNPPAVVLSEEHLAQHHQLLLDLTYPDDYQSQRQAIEASALLGSFGKPTLLALVLGVLWQKLDSLLDRCLAASMPATRSALREWLRALLLRAAQSAEPPPSPTLGHDDTVAFLRGFTEQLVRLTSVALTVFRTGDFPDPSAPPAYQEISNEPILAAVYQPDFPTEQLGYFAAGLALIGKGLAGGDWEAALGSSPDEGVIALRSTSRTVPIYLVKDAVALSRLEAKPFFEDHPEAVILVADGEPPRARRTPRGTYGRVGRATFARFNIPTNLDEASCADEFYEAFQLAGGF